MIKAETEIEIRYAETDQMGVVYHTNYLVWFEIGRTKLIENMGFKYAELEERGILAPVTEISASYKKPLRYGEKAMVRTSVKQYTGVKVVYEYVIYNNSGEECVTGYSSHVCVRKENFRPISIKKLLPDWHEAYMKARREE